MGRLKTKKVSFNKETGQAIYIYACNGTKFVGSAVCHEDDMDMCSELVGTKLAETRAYLKYLKFRSKELVARLDVLKGLESNVSSSKDYKVAYGVGKKIRKEIEATEVQLNEVKTAISVLPGLIKDEIESRDKLYQAIRKRRAGEKYTVGLFKKDVTK